MVLKPESAIMKWNLSEIGDGTGKPFPFKIYRDRSYNEIDRTYAFTTSDGTEYRVSFRSGFTKRHVNVSFYALRAADAPQANVYRVMQTIINCAKHLHDEFTNKRLKNGEIFDGIRQYEFAPTAGKEAEISGITSQRGKLYTAFIRKQFPSWTIRTQGDGYVTVTSPIKETVLTEIGDGSSKPYKWKLESETITKPRRIDAQYIFNCENRDRYTVSIYGVNKYNEWKPMSMVVAFDITRRGVEIPEENRIYRVMQTIVECCKDFSERHNKLVKAFTFDTVSKYGERDLAPGDTQRGRLYVQYIKRQFPRWKLELTQHQVWIYNPLFAKNK